MKIKQKKLGGVVYDFVSLEQPVEFVCDRCLKPKKAKKHFEYESGTGKKWICNGCFGELNARINKIGNFKENTG
jgi:hypothetical protein